MKSAELKGNVSFFCDFIQVFIFITNHYLNSKFVVVSIIMNLSKHTVTNVACSCSEEVK